jgi:hypothetical protein
MGVACHMGDSQLCQCMKPGSQGTQLCRGDSTSPTGGSWGPCTTCIDPLPPKSGTGGALAPLPPSLGSGGRAASGSGGIGGSRMFGTGGSRAMTGGSSGSRGSGNEPDSTPAPASGGNCTSCNQPCFPVGILPCCRIDGSCGCTWAPGAYCL